MHYRFTLGSAFKFFMMPVIFLAFSINGFAQLTLTSGSPNAFIDFSNSMPASVGTTSASPARGYEGRGFSPSPVIGALNSNAWSTNGSLYGSTYNTGGWAMGMTAVDVTTGGFYAETAAPGTIPNPSFMVQASGSFFQNDNNTLDLRIKNTDASQVITKIDLSYDLFVRNNQTRSSSITFAYSKNGTTWIDIPAADYASPTTLDALGWRKVAGPGFPRTISITGLTVVTGGFAYLRWIFNDAGSGGRDEIGLDNIDIKSTYAAACIPPTLGPSALTFNPLTVLAQQMDISFTRGNGSGALVIASTSPTLNTPVNTGVYAANSTYGAGDAIGTGFVVYNGTAASPVNFTLFGLDPTTMYYFWVYEYGFPTSPCYKTPGLTGSQKTVVGTGTLATYFFRTRVSGNWNNAATWESCATLTGTYSPSTKKPTSAAAGIEIKSSHKVTLTANETAKNLFIRSGGVLDNGGTSGTAGSILTFSTSGTQFTIDNGGKFSVWGNAPTFSGGALAEVLNGGMVEALGNTSGGSDDIAASGSAFTFRTGAIFNWNTAFSFSSSNVTYFKNISEIPIFRISRNTGNVGAGNPTYINGVFDVQGNISWQNAGIKYFRNGITGSGNLSQDVTSGQFVLYGVATLSGTGIISLDGPGIQINISSPVLLDPNGAQITTLASDKAIFGTGAAKFTVVNGYKFYTGNFAITGDIPFDLASGGILGIGSPGGISNIPNTGNIQSTSLLHSFSPSATYIYNGTVNQVTGNYLPNTLTQYLNIEAIGKTVTLTNSPFTITGWLTLTNSDFLIPGKDVSFGCNFIPNTYLSATGFIVGDQTTVAQFTGGFNQVPLIKDKSSLGKIIFQKTGGVITFGFDVDIYTGIDFVSAAYLNTVNFNYKNITLKSTATNTAYFGRNYTNNLSNLTNFTIERYIPSDAAHGKSWQLLAVPITPSFTGQTINDAWQEGATSIIQIPKQYYGTIITGAVANAGFDIITPVGSTVKTYVPATDTWLSITNTTTLKVATNIPYLILVRGDRTVTTYNAASKPTTLRTNGKIYYGISGATLAPNVSLTVNKYSAVSNPYASPIDFKSMVDNSYLNDLDEVYYAWDPLLHGSYGLGGYQTISKANAYKPSPGGTTTYPTGVVAKNIQSGQGFLVHSTDPTLTQMPGIIFNENQKITDYNMVYRPEQSTLMSLTSSLTTASGKMADGNVIVYNSSYSNNNDKYDAKKFKQDGENFGIISNGELLTIETRNSVKAGDTLQFVISNLKAITYTFKFQPENFNAPVRAFLNDRFLGSKQEISLTDSTNINFLVSDAAESRKATRFFITFQKKAKTNYNIVTNPELSEDITKEKLVAYPNPVTNKSFTIELSDFEVGNYNMYFMGSNGTVYINKKITLSGKTQKEKLDLPFYILPGSYRLVVEGEGVKSNIRVVVN